jgi:hypothetical protein|tara:strand:+ start:15456 stop:16667 length:1212 start_codon:yes stop_codon:yes gene_type:complete
MDSWGAESSPSIAADEIILAATSLGQPADLKFPLDFVRDKIFLTGITGSGKSWTGGLIMEEINRVGLQFVCFDTLGAHGGMSQLPNVEELNPKGGETLNIKGLIDRLKTEPTSFVINISDLNLEKQQQVVAEYCDDLLMAKLGKGIMTIFEECQDFVPQQGKPVSFDGIVRLCKLGRQNGYGVCLISQRPASVSKEALSQCSTYMIHNLINHRDLKAVEDQMGFGTDKGEVKKVLGGISAAQQGEVVCYSPSYFRDEGFFRASKIREDRKVTHTGNNIEMKPATYSPHTENTPEPSRTLAPIGEWSKQTTALGSEGESFGMSDLPPQDSLRGLASVDVQEDFPEMEYIPLSERHRIEVDENAKSLESDSIEEPKSIFSHPIAGIGLAIGISGLLFVAVKGIYD